MCKMFYQTYFGIGKYIAQQDWRYNYYYNKPKYTVKCLVYIKPVV